MSGSHTAVPSSGVLLELSFAFSTSSLVLVRLHTAAVPCRGEELMAGKGSPPLVSRPRRERPRAAFNGGQVLPQEREVIRYLLCAAGLLEICRMAA